MRIHNLWTLRDGKRAKMCICVAIWSTGPPPSTKICSYTNGIFLVKKDFIQPNKKSISGIDVLLKLLKRNHSSPTVLFGAGYSQVELDSLLNPLE